MSPFLSGREFLLLPTGTEKHYDPLQGCAQDPSLTPCWMAKTAVTELWPVARCTCATRRRRMSWPPWSKHTVGALCDYTISSQPPGPVSCSPPCPQQPSGSAPPLQSEERICRPLLQTEELQGQLLTHWGVLWDGAEGLSKTEPDTLQCACLAARRSPGSAGLDWTSRSPAESRALRARLTGSPPALSYAQFQNIC